MELWAKVNGEVKKFQGSMLKVMKDLASLSKAELCAVNASKKELRRFKREFRKSGRDLVKAAQSYVNWASSCKVLFKD